MHVTELTEDHIKELKEYIEINELGHIITKKRITYKSSLMKNGVSGDSKTKIGKRRGTKTKYGMGFGFKFPSNKEKLTCKAREVVWVLSNGIYPPEMKVVSKNGDLFDDRLANLHLVKCNNGRKPGSKDSTKRQRRDILSSKQEMQVVKLRKNGLTKGQIAEEMNTTKSVVEYALKRAVNRGKLKVFFNTHKLEKFVYDQGCQNGIYLIYACSLNGSKYISKGYIGSSRSATQRIKQHFYELENGRHYNSEMQGAYDSGKYKFVPFWIERGDFEHGETLALETEYLNKYESVSLFNKWSQPSLEEIQPYLDKYKHYLDDESRYTVDENGCWNWKRVKPDGYSKEIQCRIDGQIKFVKPHRLSYYHHRGEYPELVRHMCDNKACVNPDHLQKGSHQQNALDKSREFRKEFEYWWLRYERDIKKLTDHFGWNGTGVALGWERKLGLREKYPDIYWENTRLLHPEEKQKQKEKKRLRRELRREKESINALEYKERAINLKRRFGGNAKEISEYLGLSHYKVQQMVKGVEEPWRELWDQDWFCTIPYDQVDVKYVQSLQKQHPEYKKQIEDYYSRIMFPLEAGLFCSFRCARYRRRA